MAEDPRGGSGIPPRDHSSRPHYPPVSGESDERMAPYHLPPPPGGPGLTLPSIQDAPPSYGGGRGYAPQPDPRASGHFAPSPTNSNGYSAPQGPQPGPPQPGSYQYHPEQRPYGEYYPPPGRGAGYPPSEHYGPYQGYGHPPGPSYGQYPGEFSRGGAMPPQQQQAAPRQRTSIACRYCRKRKIRCSGYQNTTNGKCMNCDKLKIDCVFQPVSSNSSTAFVPVSAVPGGVPAGTRLYGAYGQPLPQLSGTASAPPMYGPPDAEYQHPMMSPGGQYPPQSLAEESRRRPRGPEDEPGLRLPPPNPYTPEEDPRRRSPASGRSTNTPPGSYHQYSQHGGYEVDRTPTPRSNSSGNPPPPPQSGGSSNVMSLGHLVDPPQRHGDQGRDIDQSMLGKLNRRS